MERIPASRIVIFLLIVACTAAVDLITKQVLFAWKALEGGAIHWLWNDHFGFQLSLNEGALFGMGQGKALIFASVAGIALLVIPIWLFYFRAAAEWWVLICMGFIMGGIIGNLYDRLGLHGLQWENFRRQRTGTVYAVRDWILCQWDEKLVWPNFNVADAALVCGAIMLMIHGVFFAKPDTAAKGEANPPSE